uniref:penicillin-binding protein 1B n=1 Tax=Thaumasiovibrio occultus TaxID=1891184 RepID=UPI000B3593D8|nr:penicillin-binding protein 1B [Thaumasiovibrio occultus]
MTKDTSPQENTAVDTPKPLKITQRPWFRILSTVTAIIFTVSLLFILQFHRDVSRIIEQRFEGQLLDIPTRVYARALTLKSGDSLRLQTLVDELNLLNYHYSDSLDAPGEYQISSNVLKMVRRPFAFPSGKEEAMKVAIRFSGDTIKSITDLDTNQAISALHIDPKYLGTLDRLASEQRIDANLDEVPQSMLDALLLTEDRDFYQHDGVSITSIARAFIANMRAGQTVQGGSTLTQQLTKNLFLTNERTLTRKLKEAYMALLIDHRYSKEQILEGYINQVYLAQSGAQGVHGFKLGALYYFGTPLKELRVEQQALLVGLIKGPSYYNPWKHIERATERRNLVLKIMFDHGAITQEDYDGAIESELGLQINGHVANRHPAFMSYIQQQTAALTSEDSLAGWQIFTTLDPLSQQSAEDAVKDTLPALPASDKASLEAALVSLDRQTGAITAMVGSADPLFAGFNRATEAKRQVGSLIKPAVYLSALRQPDTYQLATPIADEPLTIELANGKTWSPRNFDREFRGHVSLIEGLVKSYNVPTVNLGMAVGLPKVIDTIEDLATEGNQFAELPSVLLGAVDMSPLDIAQVYQAIGNLGNKAPYFAVSAIVNNEAEVVYQHSAENKQVVESEAAWLTLYAMQHTVTDGTARALGQTGKRYQLAGKTGTTDHNRDSWYAGIDGREVVTVWLGHDDNKDSGLTGSRGALKVYQDYINEREPLALEINRPTKVVDQGYNVDNQGLLAASCYSPQYYMPAWHPEPITCEPRERNGLEKLVDSIFSW